MIFLILIIFALPGILLGKYIFKRYFNPLTVYTAIWYGMINLYYLKLIRYDDLRMETWLFIAGAYLSMLLGSVTYFMSKNFLDAKLNIKTHKLEKVQIFSDDGIVIKYAIIVFSIIGFISAFQHWFVLINKYGSLLGVLLKAPEIYRLRVEGKIKGVIPYIHTFSYVAVFLSAIYTAYKNKFTFLTFLPLIAVFIKELANVGRSNILLAVILFISTYFVFKSFYAYHFGKQEKKVFRNVVALLLILGIFIASSAFMRAFRGTVETFSGTSRALSSYKENLLISPSIYLYLSAHLGVFNKYLELEAEQSAFAQYTFQPVYNLLTKLGMINKKMRFYHKGYYIPVWTNSGTYLREMHADFGIFGILLMPYLLGLLATKFWISFFEKGSLVSLIVLIQIFTILIFSFFLTVTRFGVWYIYFILLLLIVPFLEKLSVFNERNKWFRMKLI